MPDPDFQHIRMSMVKDVAVVEILTKEMYSPNQAQELCAELALVTAQDWAKRLLVNFRGVSFLGSTGFAALFALVHRAMAEGRQVKFCDMEPAVRLGAEIIGLDQIAEIHEKESSALHAFAQA
jgi:anti-sigma B factor antagonist